MITTIMKHIKHQWLHLTGKNTVKIVYWHDEDYIYIGVKCEQCGLTKIKEKLKI